MGKETECLVNENGFLYYRDRACVPNNDELKKSILEEAHSGSFAIHHGSTKMYRDVKTSYWWSGMKKDVSDFATKCIQKVKAEHQVLRVCCILLEYPSGNGTESQWILWSGYH